MTKLAAILLAAGRSRRMGAFKPLLPFGNKTVIRSCIDNLRAAGVENIIVVVGHRADEIKDHLRDSSVSYAVNDEPESEMSVSIACGVRTLPETTGAVLIALTDHPAVSGEVIRLIIEQWRAGARLVVPEHNRRGGHPVLIDSAFRDELLSLDPERGLKSFFDLHRDSVSRVSVNSPYIARDMDTWDDYVALHEEIFGKLPVIQVSEGPKEGPGRD
ncbi:MAG: nucleotidyltransferase family protein [Pyrinomonadaceae bacterium]